MRVRLRGARPRRRPSSGLGFAPSDGVAGAAGRARVDAVAALRKKTRSGAVGSACKGEGTSKQSEAGLGFFASQGGRPPLLETSSHPPLPPSLGPAGEMRRPPPTPKKCILVCPYASSLGLKARQNTPAFDAAIYRPYSTSYQLQPSFHTSSTEPEPTARARRAGKEFY